MTICIAVICDNYNSIVVSSDYMLTNPMLSIQFEHPEKKMNILSGNCVALTAGDALAHDELFSMVQSDIEAIKEPSILNIVEILKKCYQEIRRREIMEMILKPAGFIDINHFHKKQRMVIPEIVMNIQREMERYDFGLEILIAGISEGLSHIQGVFDPGTSKNFNSIGFHAIGSGSPHAINALIGNECNQKTPLENAIILVYEAKKIAEKAPGVGHTMTNITIITKKGIFIFSKEDINKLDGIYKLWKDRNKEWKIKITNLLKEVMKKNGDK